MKFLKEPSGRGWVAVNSTIKDDADLRSRLLSADICFSDLDDTDAFAPAKKIAFDKWFSRLLNDDHYLGWFLDTTFAYLRDGRCAESEQWALYRETFLQDLVARENIGESFRVESARALVFPGVADFYKRISALKFYVTQNVLPITGRFVDLFDFMGAFTEVDDKGKIIENFVLNHPRYQHYLVKGDMNTDYEMLDRLRFLMNKGRILEVTGCYVAFDCEDDLMDPRFDINIGRNYFGLADILDQK